MTIRQTGKRILAPFFKRWHSRGDGIVMELAFWERWFASRGLEWPDEYRMRTDDHALMSGWHLELVRGLGLPCVTALDVGSGPLTAVGKIVPGIDFALTCCDPLADRYRELYARHDVITRFAPMAVGVEALSSHFPSQAFDWVNCQNALDHSIDPCAGIRQMCIVVKPGGLISLHHEENEAEREGWRGFHRWNFSLDGAADMAISGVTVRTRLSSELPKDVAIESCRRQGEHIAVRLRRKA